MKRAALYSGRIRSRETARRSAPGAIAAARAAAASLRLLGARVHGLLHRPGRPALIAAGGLLALLIALVLVLLRGNLQPAPRELAQEDIDAAVRHTLENRSLPSKAARAAESVRQSVVRVRGFALDPKHPEAGEQERNTGSGVVIVDKGLILTNLHVVYGAKRVTVTFFDGLESEAELVSVHPENDLAVVRAKTIPDDLPAATMGSTQRLQPGDEVVAVGFPFGIGPSVTAGVISGLNREFRSPEGQRLLTGLIQFDAAVNPGNSGGPLVTMDGDVVGIVTAILNPSEARTFIGIGFAATIEGATNTFGIPPF